MNRSTPAALGYRMPPEWHRHNATWLAWPKDSVTWPDRVPAAQEAFLAVIAALSVHETVHLLVDDEAAEQTVRCRLRGASVKDRVIFHRIRTVDSWIRDYGPNFLLGQDDSPAYNDWVFNAWGNKYEELKKDDAIPAKLERILGIPRFTPGIVLEGGSIDVDGGGVCMTTEQCLLNPNRNPRLSRKQIEQHLKDYLGVEKILWLGEGISGDDTDGHIDDLARFVSPETIVCALEDDPRDPNCVPLRENYRRLERATNARGVRYSIVPLPMPKPINGDEGRLPASYANFYIANGVVLVPTFSDPNDGRALEILGKVFPDRSVLGVDCRDLVWGMGTIHCVTQQQPP